MENKATYKCNGDRLNCPYKVSTGTYRWFCPFKGCMMAGVVYEQDNAEEDKQ